MDRTRSRGLAAPPSRSPNAHACTLVPARAQALTKKIQMRIEETMASRAATDGGGLSLVSADTGPAASQGMKQSLGIGRSANKSVLSKKKKARGVV